ncbi:hypothetical protein D3C87_1247410 [compost metagenome]
MFAGTGIDGGPQALRLDCRRRGQLTVRCAGYAAKGQPHGRLSLGGQANRQTIPACTRPELLQVIRVRRVLKAVVGQCLEQLSNRYQRDACRFRLWDSSVRLCQLFQRMLQDSGHGLL